MEKANWEATKVYGRDEVLVDIESRAVAYKDRVVGDVLNVMRDYEVDLYRFIIAVGDRYGLDTAFEIMSDTVTDKRLKWLDQNWDSLDHEGTDLDRGLDLFVSYFKLKDGNFEMMEKSDGRAVLKRKEMVDVISHTCKVLDLDILEVNNKIYARATNFMLERINPRLKHVVLEYEGGWYKEMIELT